MHIHKSSALQSYNKAKMHFIIAGVHLWFRAKICKIKSFAQKSKTSSIWYHFLKILNLRLDKLYKIAFFSSSLQSIHTATIWKLTMFLVLIIPQTTVVLPVGSDCNVDDDEE